MRGSSSLINPVHRMPDEDMCVFARLGIQAETDLEDEIFLEEDFEKSKKGFYWYTSLGEQ